MKMRIKRLEHRFGGTYSIIGDFVLRIDHAAVRKGRSAEQMLLPFFPPLFIRLSDEEGRNPLDRSASVSAFGGS